MALYLLSAKHVSRRQGRSFTAAAAYRTGGKLYCVHDGQTHDYSRRGDVLHTDILVPARAPPEFLDVQTLCSAVEQAEKRKDARTAREIVIALPRELAPKTNMSMVKDFVTHCFVAQGMCAVVAIHQGASKGTNHGEPDHLKTLPHNPHAHILLTTRPVGPDGFSDKKNRDWDKREFLIELREQWAIIQNRYLLRKGLDMKVSHESYAKQGIDRKPAFHLGPILSAMERRGVRTRLGDMNRHIEAHNRLHDEPTIEEQEHGHDRGWSR